MTQVHHFHIPVLGAGYSLDAPVKVAHYGISSCLVLMDYVAIETLYKYYCQKANEPCEEYKGKDANSNYITAYLNLINKLVKRNFDNLKNTSFEVGSEIVKYFELLSDESDLKQAYLKMNNIKNAREREKQQQWLRDQIKLGSIDVNIMSRVDFAHYDTDGSQLPQEYNDAHASLRGYAQSDLCSSVVFSAGMNPKLFSYMEQFRDFYHDENGIIKKQITLRVMDYRSALIQGKILAKKGLWVSEFCIESGLNCGGHTFAADGKLLGPILEELKNNRNTLYKEIFEVYSKALKAKNLVLTIEPTMRISAQGGVGTNEEHNFLLRYYQLDSVGWGSPFLLVPEVMNVDNETLEQLCNAKEEDYYLSDASPLGLKYNNFRPSTMHKEKYERLKNGKPGFACPNNTLGTDTTFTERPICTASRKYMNEKIKQIEGQNLTLIEKERAIHKIAEKSCFCIGLSTSMLKFYNLPIDGNYVSICPGPNLAYFNKKATLREMTDHIYGRTNLISVPRPHMFIKELTLYVNHLKRLIEESDSLKTEKEQQSLINFKSNILEGIRYYYELIPKLEDEPDKVKENMQSELENLESIVFSIMVPKVLV